MVKPITPPEAYGAKVFPDAVIEAFNEVITEHYSHGSAHFNQEEVVQLIVKKGIARREIFANDWLDIEPLFEKAGWEVDYDKPGYNEFYEANYTFTAKNNK
jgi:hypothetical protein